MRRSLWPNGKIIDLSHYDEELMQHPIIYEGTITSEAATNKIRHMNIMGYTSCDLSFS
jgi:hypothetical protein